MIDNLIRFSVYNKLIISVFVVFLILWGSYSLTQLPIDAVPDITNNQVQVITVAPALAALEVEQFMTHPLELAFANVPKVQEIRSISRFGLSVVTVVFKEDADLYTCRQLIGEQIRKAEMNIPEGFGRPDMAPISTGLGEIYQYTLRVEKGYESQFSLTELRTIQDWLVKRQLAGIEGVTEVSSFGGKVKEYEIAINFEKLRAYDIGIKEIFDAIQANNQNTGGSYIVKGENIFFIRCDGMAKTLEDLEKVVVKTVNNLPILIKDVAKVQFGNSIRYGAMSRNGEGETVGGVILMLKGANSAQVIQKVKERMEQIQKNLPKGLTIDPFIDRAELIQRAIHTVSNNLLEGALIVIFVLILLLGNLRAGLIVASVIPLALLFAFSMMNIFGISANLMSLGAIDFGLVVDGAVIIVEAIIHATHHYFPKHDLSDQKLSNSQLDEIVFESTKKIRQSAAFGEIIILMVYLPILALVGVEGKMFKPMAETVILAILGALILSLTYVPMMSAWGLSKKITFKKNISDKIIDFLLRGYLPIINFALRKKAWFLVPTFVFFGISIWLFSTLGGEFIPTLDEGNFAVTVRISTGSSLEKMVETTSKAEKILLENFPEVKQVVSRIGNSEIPTDPMPIEEGDIMIILKPKNEWVSGTSMTELATKMKEKLGVLAGVYFEFLQPIQMRSNELIAGVRGDVAVKIFGENLNILFDKANEMAKVIENVKGLEDLKVEQVEGTPQIMVSYDRQKMANYGLNIKDLNRIINTAFAGGQAGVVYEGLKRFNVTVRFEAGSRQSIDDIKNLYVDLPNGFKIPLQQVANVSFVDAPLQISREDTKRRITLTFNVRGRDVESVVLEVQKILAKKVNLPAGYYVDFGGQFENLLEAKQRLSVAVPVALGMILLLLYFTFQSVLQSFMIFTAIPLSAIGGVFALWLRDMPFSISAGIGFIALFGVAVLNGIVLIGYFNQLKNEGLSLQERILEGVKVRFRPVLMTASVASLGFLPMAISHSAGAEVQKPLATVVIGGLLTATILTLVVLPLIYSWINKFYEKESKPVA